MKKGIFFVIIIIIINIILTSLVYVSMPKKIKKVEISDNVEVKDLKKVITVGDTFEINVNIKNYNVLIDDEEHTIKKLGCSKNKCTFKAIREGKTRILFNDHSSNFDVIDIVVNEENYIYRYLDDNNYYFATSKPTNIDDENIDTYKCKDTECRLIKGEKSHAIIKDKDIFIYDFNNDTKIEINISLDDDKTYQFLFNDDELEGIILYKKENKDKHAYYYSLLNNKITLELSNSTIYNYYTLKGNKYITAIKNDVVIKETYLYDSQTGELVYEFKDYPITYLEKFSIGEKEYYLGSASIPGKYSSRFIYDTNFNKLTNELYRIKFINNKLYGIHNSKLIVFDGKIQDVLSYDVFELYDNRIIAYDRKKKIYGFYDYNGNLLETIAQLSINQDLRNAGNWYTDKIVGPAVYVINSDREIIKKIIYDEKTNKIVIEEGN